MGPPAAVPQLRPRRVLPLLPHAARVGALPGEHSPRHAFDRTGRGLALVLRRRTTRLTRCYGDLRIDPEGRGVSTEPMGGMAELRRGIDDLQQRAADMAATLRAAQQR